MSRQYPTLFTSFTALAVLLLALFGAFVLGQGKAKRGLRIAIEDLVKKSQLASDLRAKLLASAEAEKSAVLAETDEASTAFAEEAKRAAAAVEADRHELGSLIERSDRAEQAVPFEEFSECWKRYQEVDREILDLAVQNTNLKALRLSFAPAGEPLDRMRASLDKLVDDSASSANAAAIAKSGYRALLPALKIHALESRHIAEAQDAEMDKIETEMRKLDEQVMSELGVLAGLLGDEQKTSVDEIRNTYADFQKVNAQIIGLSRRNSNVRSLAISLGQKRKLTAECQERLETLQESIRSENFRATR